MGVEKSIWKRDHLLELAREAKDRREGLIAEYHRMCGTAAAFRMAREAVERDVFARLRRELDEGKLDESGAATVDRYLRTCLNLLTHNEKHASSRIPMHQGRIDECTDTVSMLEKNAVHEQAAIDGWQAAIAAGTVAQNDDGSLERPAGEDARPTGVHPGPSLKAEREEVAEESEQELEPEPEEKEKRRRGRPPRNTG